MATIVIGPGATDRNTTGAASYTTVDLNTPANADGKITSFQVFANTDLGGFKIGTFYGSGNSWTVRDYESIGDVDSGSVQTFPGLECSVETGDVLGHYFSSGSIEAGNSGGVGFGYDSGDNMGGGTNTYNMSAYAAWLYSAYGTGYTLGGPAMAHYYRQLGE